jgi:hypothetical protein
MYHEGCRSNIYLLVSTLNYVYYFRFIYVKRCDTVNIFGEQTLQCQIPFTMQACTCEYCCRYRICTRNSASSSMKVEGMRHKLFAHNNFLPPSDLLRKINNYCIFCHGRNVSCVMACLQALSPVKSHSWRCQDDDITAVKAMVWASSKWPLLSMLKFQTVTHSAAMLDSFVMRCIIWRQAGNEI